MTTPSFPGLQLLGKDISYKGEEPSITNSPMMIAWSVNAPRRHMHPNIQLSFAGFSLLGTDPDVAARWKESDIGPWGVTGTAAIVMDVHALEHFKLDTSCDVLAFPEEIAVPFSQMCIDTLSQLFCLDAPTLTGMIGKELRKMDNQYWATGLAIAVPCSKKIWDQGYELVKIHAEAAIAFKHDVEVVEVSDDMDKLANQIMHIPSKYLN